jgi:hypothetical protein
MQPDSLMYENISKSNANISKLFLTTNFSIRMLVNFKHRKQKFLRWIFLMKVMLSFNFKIFYRAILDCFKHFCSQKSQTIKFLVFFYLLQVYFCFSNSSENLKMTFTVTILQLDLNWWWAMLKRFTIIFSWDLINIQTEGNSMFSMSFCDIS